jgi:hypothetical protein
MRISKIRRLKDSKHTFLFGASGKQAMAIMTAIGWVHEAYASYKMTGATWFPLNAPVYEPTRLAPERG